MTYIGILKEDWDKSNKCQLIYQNDITKSYFNDVGDEIPVIAIKTKYPLKAILLEIRKKLNLPIPLSDFDKCILGTLDWAAEYFGANNDNIEN